MAHGEITHIDIPSDDFDRTRSFYEGVFGWKFQAVQDFPDFEMAVAGPSGITGGMGKRGTTAPDKPRIYVSVDSIDDALAKVTDLGGSIVVEKLEVPGMGWYAAVNDSEGSEIGIWENAAG